MTREAQTSDAAAEAGCEGSSVVIRQILLVGLASLASVGGMEYHNLGNYVIMEPLILSLHNKFPAAEIRTTIQMSDRFCQQYHITSLRKRRMWAYDPRCLLAACLDLVKASLWRVLKAVGVRCGVLLRSGDLLREVSGADLVLDLSGDLYGDNVHAIPFVEANARLAMAILLGKPTCMIASSPGPFRRRWRRMLAKLILLRLSLVSNREPVSTQLLASKGIRSERIITTACPSVLFKRMASEESERLLAGETPKINSKPLVGLIMCGWNMREGPYNKWPRSEQEYEPFVELVDHLVNHLALNVCVMSHQNSTDKSLNLAPGNDHRIIAQLLHIVRDRHTGDRVFTLTGLYDAAASKAIVLKFDALISGRIHGAVQGLSQCIPTAIIDYGHEPKAHKLRGIAQLYGVEQYIADPREPCSMKDVASRLWDNRVSVRKMLEQRVPIVEQQALRSFDVIEEVCLRHRIQPEERVVLSLR